VNLHELLERSARARSGHNQPVERRFNLPGGSLRSLVRDKMIDRRRAIIEAFLSLRSAAGLSMDDEAQSEGL
jgi:hypothetical protein